MTAEAVTARDAVVRNLTESEIEQVAELVGSVTAEVPLFDWVLGDASRDAETRTWFARILLGPLVIAGQAVGVVSEGEVVGVLAYLLPGAEQGAVTYSRRDLEIAMSIPGFAERLTSLTGIGALPAPEPDAINVFVAAVAPRARGGLVVRMLEPVTDLCHRTGRRFYAWTARTALRDRWMEVFGLEVFATRQVDDVTLYGLKSPLPPRRVGSVDQGNSRPQSETFESQSNELVNGQLTQSTAQNSAPPANLRSSYFG